MEVKVEYISMLAEEVHESHEYTVTTHVLSVWSKLVKLRMNQWGDATVDESLTPPSFVLECIMWQKCLRQCSSISHELPALGWKRFSKSWLFLRIKDSLDNKVVPCCSELHHDPMELDGFLLCWAAKPKPTATNIKLKQHMKCPQLSRDKYH